eukprot:m.47250 g.47250  ORF g.47250 m.47250 type:complete len:527 (+) comp10752_c0_seq1:206-1786(+)
MKLFWLLLLLAVVGTIVLDVGVFANDNVFGSDEDGNIVISSTGFENLSLGFNGETLESIVARHLEELTPRDNKKQLPTNPQTSFVVGADKFDASTDMAHSRTNDDIAFISGYTFSHGFAQFGLPEAVNEKNTTFVEGKSNGFVMRINHATEDVEWIFFVSAGTNASESELCEGVTHSLSSTSHQEGIVVALCKVTDAYIYGEAEAIGGAGDLLLVALDGLSGELLWAKQFGTENYDVPRALVNLQEEDGNLLVFGESHHANDDGGVNTNVIGFRCSFDPNNDQDVVVAVEPLNPPFPNTTNPDHMFAGVPFRSNVFLVGNTRGTFPGNDAPGAVPCAVTALLLENSEWKVWQHSGGDTTTRFLSTCTFDGIFNPVVVGSLRTNIDGEEDNDVFIAMFSDENELLWSTTIGTFGHDQPRKVLCDIENSQIIIAGHTEGAFYPYENQGGYDIFVMKAAISLTDDEPTFSVTSIHQFGSPSSDFVSSADVLEYNPSTNQHTILISGNTYDKNGRKGIKDLSVWMATMDI